MFSSSRLICCYWCELKKRYRAWKKAYIYRKFGGIPDPSTIPGEQYASMKLNYNSQLIKFQNQSTEFDPTVVRASQYVLSVPVVLVDYTYRPPLHKMVPEAFSKDANK